MRGGTSNDSSLRHEEGSDQRVCNATATIFRSGVSTEAKAGGVCTQNDSILDRRLPEVVINQVTGSYAVFW